MPDSPTGTRLPLPITGTPAAAAARPAFAACATPIHNVDVVHTANKDRHCRRTMALRFKLIPTTTPENVPVLRTLFTIDALARI